MFACTPQTQKDNFEAILKQVGRGSFAKALDIKNIEGNTLDDKLERYSLNVPIYDHKSFSDRLKQVIGESKPPQQLYTTADLLTAGKPYGLFLKRGNVYPTSKSMLGAFVKFESEVGKVLAQSGIKVKGKTFHLYLPEVENSTPKDISQPTGSILGMMEGNRGLLAQGRYLPKNEDIRKAGKSRYQKLHAALDALTKYGKDITVLTPPPRLLTELALMLAQREGRFRRLGWRGQSA